MPRFPLILCAIVAVAGFAFGQLHDPALTEGLGLLEEARTTLEEKPLTLARDFFAQLTKKDSGNAIYFFNLARTESYLVEMYASRRDNKNAGRVLDDAVRDAQLAIRLNDNSADAHSLLADLYGRQISLGGFLSGMRYGPKSDAENKRALALDANNPRVHASLGRQYLHSPKMFGGDVDKAIESFRKATQLDPNYDEPYVWLAIACRKKGDADAAGKALHEALRLNPRSAFARHTQSAK